MNRWKQAFSGFLLVAFVAIKVAFWLALAPSPVSPTAPQSGTRNSPPVHACACTGAAVCRCGPGGCCNGAKVPPSSSSFSEAVVQIPKLCGSFSQGAGPVTDVPCLLCDTWNWRPLKESHVCLVVTLPLTLPRVSFDPDPPVPKA